MNDRLCNACGWVNDGDVSQCAKCEGVNFTGIRARPGCFKCGAKHDPSLDVCPNCGNTVGKNADISRRGTGLNLVSHTVILTTGQGIPNRDIEEVIGLVFAAGNAAWTLEGTSKKSNTAMGKASNNLMSQAMEMGADAVVAIQISMDGSGTAVNRSQTVTLMGTAVKLAPLSAIRH